MSADRVRCKYCGCKRGYHRTSDEKCPPQRSFGNPVSFPPHISNEKKWDKQIAAFWATTTTHFSPL